MRIILSIAIAIFCGVLIGASIGGSIQTSWPFGEYLWAIGGLVGGFFAYCAVDFAHFRAGVTRAFENAVMVFIETYEAAATWHPNRRYWRLWRAHAKLYWRAVMWEMCALYAIIASVMVGFLTGMAIYGNGLADNLQHGGDLVFTVGGLAALAVLFMSPMMMLAPGRISQHNRRRIYQFESSMSRWAVLNLNPISVTVWTLYGAYQVALWFADLIGSAITRIPLAAQVVRATAAASVRSAAHFVGYLIAYVHSEVRVICFVDTALFVVVAHFMGFTLWGNLLAAALGAGFGVLNYLVVGIRLLKVAPARRTS